MPLRIQGPPQLPLSHSQTASQKIQTPYTLQDKSQTDTTDHFVLNHPPQILNPAPPGHSALWPQQSQVTKDVRELAAVLQQPEFCEQSQEIKARHVKTNLADYSANQRSKFDDFLAKNRQWRDRIYKTLYAKREIWAHRWLYPAAGYDLATLLLMQDLDALKQRSHCFVMIQNSTPFVEIVNDKIPDVCLFKTENIYDNSNPDWADSVVHMGLVESTSQQNKGILGPLLGRLKAYFSDSINIRQVVCFADKKFVPKWKKRISDKPEPEQKVHGLIVFQIKNGGPLHYCFYINGTLKKSPGIINSKGSLSEHMLSLGELRYLSMTLGVLKNTNGLFVRGSQGCLSPRKLNSQGLSRNHLLNLLAINKGLLLEGMHQNPDFKYREPDPEPEVTPELKHGDFRGDKRVAYQVNDKTLYITPLDISEYDRLGFKWSYYKGARASRLFTTP